MTVGKPTDFDPQAIDASTQNSKSKIEATAVNRNRLSLI